jgi:hypothetical protein
MSGCGYRRFNELTLEAQIRFLKSKTEELEKRIRELERQVGLQ